MYKTFAYMCVFIIPTKYCNWYLLLSFLASFSGQLLENIKYSGISYFQYFVFNMPMHIEGLLR